MGKTAQREKQRKAEQAHFTIKYYLEKARRIKAAGDESHLARWKAALKKGVLRKKKLELHHYLPMADAVKLGNARKVVEGSMSRKKERAYRASQYGKVPTLREHDAIVARRLLREQPIQKQRAAQFAAKQRARAA